MVGHLGHRQAQRLSELAIALAIGVAPGNQVIALEYREPYLARRVPARRAQVGDGVGEEPPNPLSLEPGIGVAVAAVSVAGCQLALDLKEVERHEGDPAAPLEPALVPTGVRDESVEAGPDIGPKAGAGRIVSLQESAGERSGKELLGEVLGVGGLQLPALAEMSVHRAPVGRDQDVESTPPGLRVRVSNGLDHRPSGRWKRGVRRGGVSGHYERTARRPPESST